MKTEAETGDIYKPKNTKDYWSSHKARRHQEQTHPSEGTCPADPLIPDLQPGDVGEDTCLLFQATQLVALC